MLFKWRPKTLVVWRRNQTKMSTDKEKHKRQPDLEEWLEENIVKIPEPQKVTLYNFEIDWSDWSGVFRVKFDDFEVEDTFGFGMEVTGYPKFSLPIFGSPLGVPASFGAIEMTPNTGKAINEGLRKTFPRFKPLGINRKTGIEIVYYSPIEMRISKPEIAETKLLVGKTYSVSVRIKEF